MGIPEAGPGGAAALALRLASGEARLPRPRLRRETARHLVLVLLFLCSAMVAFFLALGAQEAQNRVKHTLLVRAAAASLLATVRDAESSQRTYLLNGEADYLLKYRKSLRAIPGLQLQLRELAEPNPAHPLRLDEIDELIGEKLAQLERTLALYAAGDRQGAVTAVDINEAKQTLGAIRGLIADLDREEDRLLTNQERSELHWRLLLLSALVSSMAAASWLAWASVRAERRSAAVLANANRALEAEVAERTKLLESERRRVEGLLSDMTHRVGNSLSLISSMLALQARGSEDPELAQALMIAHDRVIAVGSAQRRLRFAADYECVDVREYLELLLEDMRLAMAMEHVRLTFQADEVELSGHDSVALGIIVNELVTNALKHAFGSGGGGHVSVTFRGETNRLVLEVSDDGAGLPRGTKRSGLGSFVLQSMVSSLDGELVQEDLRADGHRPGTLCRLTFPGKTSAAGVRTT